MATLTRAELESELISSLGPRLTYVSLDGVTKDGTNSDLNGPIRRAIRSMGVEPAGLTVADTDLSTFVGYAQERLFDYARLESLTRIAERCTEIDTRAGALDYKLKQFHDQVMADIEDLQERVRKPYGPMIPAPAIGTMGGQGMGEPARFPNDAFDPYRTRSRPNRWPYP